MKETRICANCGAEHPLDAMFRVGSDWLCESCFDEGYVRCADCDRILRRDRAYWDGDDNAYCASC